jgi:hypothetical protein
MASTVEAMKGMGKVVSVSADSITIAVSQPPQGMPAKVTVAFGPTTVYLDAGATVSARPSLAVDEVVVFGAQRSGTGPYQLVSLEVNPSPAPGGDRGSRLPAGTATETEAMKGVATVVTSENGTLTLRFTDGPLAGKTLTASTDSQTSFSVGKEPCAPASVPAGSQVGAVVVNNDAGTYSVRQVILVHAG